MKALKERPAFPTALVFLMAALISACSSSKEQPSPNVKPSTPEAFAQWYQECWDGFNLSKWDDFKKCYAANASSQQIGYGKFSVTGPEAIVKASEDFFRTFPDARGEGQLILVSGNHLTSIYLLKGTNTGPLFGPDGKLLPGRNQKIGLFFGHSIEVDSDVRVAKEIGIMDGITLETQMGFLKNRGRPLAEIGVPAPIIVIAKNDEMEMKNVETETAQLAAWNKHDQAAVDMYEADDYVLHDLTQPDDSNKMQTDQMNKTYWKGFSDAKINATTIWGAGNYVSVVGTFEGTNDGDFAPGNAKKTGKKITLPFIDIFRFDVGKIAEEWLFFDSASLLTQLSAK
jgi:predicted ester cyclase